MFDNIASTYATGGMKESTEIPVRISHKTSSVRIPAAAAPNALSHSWITGNAVIIFVETVKKFIRNRIAEYPIA